MDLFAAHASVILEVDQGRDDANRVSVLADQERIARDLHDTVIQRLFASGLSLQAVAGQTDEPITARLMSVVDDLDATIRQIRIVIFGMDRPSTSSHVSLRAQLLEVCVEAARALGFDPTVRFDGPLDAGVAAEDVGEVVAVVREALANVARHAAARHANVEVAVDADRLRVVVADDGRGLDEMAPSGGHGVENLRTRAAVEAGRSCSASVRRVARRWSGRYLCAPDRPRGPVDELTYSIADAWAPAAGRSGGGSSSRCPRRSRPCVFADPIGERVPCRSGRGGRGAGVRYLAPLQHTIGRSGSVPPNRSVTAAGCPSRLPSSNRARGHEFAGGHPGGDNLLARELSCSSRARARASRPARWAVRMATARSDWVWRRCQVSSSITAAMASL